MGKAKILVVDDEPSILNVVTAYLRAEGYEYKTASDGNEGLSLVKTFSPDLIILDIMLPGRDGIEVLSQLRRESNAYVIMLTARSEETDKLVGLSVGADDYLTKPFSPRELMARIKAALRRYQNPMTETERKVYAFAHVRLDTGSRRVWVDEQEVELTSLEFDLLVTLSEHHNLVLSRQQLLEKVWGYDYFGDMRVVDVHIGHLRQKLGETFIETVRGAGYRFEDKDK
ncbi:MAG: response regulator transcription factor [Chloroflexi bacterium]|nr:response regulator transcription factor [Chloroflexota bacterium]